MGRSTDSADRHGLGDDLAIRPAAARLDVTSGCAKTETAAVKDLCTQPAAPNFRQLHRSFGPKKRGPQDDKYDDKEKARPKAAVHMCILLKGLSRAPSKESSRRCWSLWGLTEFSECHRTGRLFLPFRARRFLFERPPSHVAALRRFPCPDR